MIACRCACLSNPQDDDMNHDDDGIPVCRSTSQDDDSMPMTPAMCLSKSGLHEITECAMFEMNGNLALV